MNSDLIEIFLKAGVLSFGRFTLKSGRESPYFFNLGQIFHGHALSVLAQSYARLIQAKCPHADVLFGPAYKGIPLASTTATACFELFGVSLGVAFDRKEPKVHGEGGTFVGSPLVGNIVLIDDVITAGSAVRASLEKMQSSGVKGTVQALVVAMDRQESMDKGGPSAITALQDELGINVSALLCFEDLITYLESNQETNASFAAHIKPMLAYRKMFGAS